MTTAAGSAGGGGSPRLPRVPLRITLVALLVLLVALALGATGVAATSMLRHYLLDQQDETLDDAARLARIARVAEACREAVYKPVGPGELFFGCQRVGSDEVVPVQGPPDPGRLPDLRHSGGREGRGPDAGLHTVPSADRHGDWRVVTTTLPEGWTVVIASDLSRDQAVIRQLVALQVAVGLVVLTVLGGAGYLLVRNSLRPLADVERTAQAIAAGDLSRRVPAGDDRTEVGRLSRSLNGMLARIESAFRAQRASEEQARASESRMRRFVADASHELRTPLTSIRGFAELYRQGAVRTPEETRRLMARIEAEGARMGGLVEDLLQLARLDQQPPLSPTPVDLAQVAGDAVHDARAVQSDRPITLHLDESLQEAPVVRGDEARLRQVVGNLISNALTHTPPSARVTVSLAADRAAPDVVVLRVADEGPGMAAEDAERVFERFYRADAARTREAGGTGLGLAIVASLVAAHGGSVELTTAPGQGATFTVRLPRSGPPPAAPDDGAAPQPPGGPATLPR